MENCEFISKTDNKSLFNQIKFLVDCAKQSYQNDLATRRQRLKELLESEEKAYENEFAGKIKSRVDENIRERQKSLMAMKEERNEEKKKFVASKKLHQNMLNCLDIRDELREKDNRETQLCQLEQMDDNLRAKAREKKEDEFWLKVQKKNEEDVDRKQAHEDALKKSMQAYQCRIVDSQLADQHRMCELNRAHLNREKVAANSRIKQNQSEEMEKRRLDALARKLETQAALNTICKQKKLLQQEAKDFEETFHREAMRQVDQEIEETRKHKGALKEAVLDYLMYLQNFKSFVADQEKKSDERCAELDNRFKCFKLQSKKGMVGKKRQLAESSHEILLKQICEEQQRKLKLEAAEKENKLIENRFARVEARDKLKERYEIKKNLDKQVEEMQRVKNEKQKEFENEMNRAEEDQAYCQELLEKYKTKGCDFLEPHPNWKLLACFEGGSRDHLGG